MHFIYNKINEQKKGMAFVTSEKLAELLNTKEFVFADYHNTALHRAFKEGDKYKSLYYLRKFIHESPFPEFYVCSECGKALHYYLKDDVFYADELTCFRDKNVSFSIPIPSGKVLVSDIFRNKKLDDLFSELEGDISTAYPGGMYEKMKLYAKLGIAHFYVGNTDPMISVTEDEIWVSRMENATSQVKGRVKTDYFWVMLCDEEILFKQLEKQFGKDNADIILEEVKQNIDFIFDAPIGDYTLSYTIGPKERDIIFATLKKNN